jgi:para-nitrobenzyl esterase
MAEGLNRRSLLAAAGGAGLVASCASPRGSNGSAAVVNTTAGPVAGVVRDGVHAFKSIPYGASPTGRRRFLPPAPRPPWTDVLDATTDRSVAPQSDPRPQPPPLPNPFAGLMSDPVALPEDEDCLRLHVWTPGLGGGGRRPVMVWLHGRGLVAGSGSGAWQDGTNVGSVSV